MPDENPLGWIEQECATVTAQRVAAAHEVERTRRVKQVRFPEAVEDPADLVKAGQTVDASPLARELWQEGCQVFGFSVPVYVSAGAAEQLRGTPDLLHQVLVACYRELKGRGFVGGRPSVWSREAWENFPAIKPWVMKQDLKGIEFRAYPSAKVPIFWCLQLPGERLAWFPEWQPHLLQDEYRAR